MSATASSVYRGSSEQDVFAFNLETSEFCHVALDCVFCGGTDPDCIVCAVPATTSTFVTPFGHGPADVAHTEGHPVLPYRDLVPSALNSHCLEKTLANP